MKAKIGIGFNILSIIFLINVSGCTKAVETIKVSVLTTSSISNTAHTTAICGGNITFDGGSEVTARGVCWSTEQDPFIADSKTTDGTGSGSFISILNNLLFNTTYFVKAYATNSAGTGYGNELSFMTTANTTGDGTGIVRDIEENTYKTIVIGTQIWMAENLRTTTFNDGSPIPNTTEVVDWAGMTTPALCWYGNDEASYKEMYGALYNWYAVNSGKLAPSGWHVPTQEERTTLIDYLGGEETAGGKMKETGFLHWDDPNTDATNSSGFTALGGGGRYGFCSGFHDIMEKGFWWTATSSDTSDYAYYHYLDKNSGGIDNTDDILKANIFGFSVRCVKD